MPRNMSFSMTTEQFRRREKTVTRRFGWWNAKPGDIYNGVEKAMGLKKGEKINVLHRIRVVAAAPEALGDMLLRPDGGHSELAKEGFPFGILCPKEFVYALASKSGKALTDQIMRIEFEYLDEQEST